MNNFKTVEKIIGYQFKDKKLLTTAFVHPSYANEKKIESNQRLEYLGDAVLELIVSDKLFKLFNLSEGELTKYRASLVNESSLAFIVDELGLDQYLLKGKGEKRNGVESKAIKCDLFEAIVGAIYLDGGFETAQKFVLSVLCVPIEKLQTEGLQNNAKSFLQEMLKGQKIVYSTTKHGESHSPTYKSTVMLDGKCMGFGEGTNKKSAEQMAAKNTIEILKKVNPYEV